MSPLAFKTSGKVTVPTPTPPQPKQPPKMDIAPLTQEQLVQALTYLLKVCFIIFLTLFTRTTLSTLLIPAVCRIYPTQQQEF